MFETIRKVMYLGLGAAAVSVDMARKWIDDLVARGEITRDEGRKLYEEYVSRIEEEGRKLDERIRGQVRDVLREMGLADQSQFTMLETRVAVLERKVEELMTKVSASEADDSE